MLNVIHPVLISLCSHTLWSERMTHGYVLMTGFKWAGTTWSVSKTSEWELKDLQEAQVPKSLFLGPCTSKASSLSSLLSLQLLTSAAPLKCFSPSKGHQDLPSQNSTPLKLFLLHYHECSFRHTSEIHLSAPICQHHYVDLTYQQECKCFCLPMNAWKKG